jgi:hypothetical protein
MPEPKISPDKSHPTYRTELFTVRMWREVLDDHCEWRGQGAPQWQSQGALLQRLGSIDRIHQTDFVRLIMKRAGIFLNKTPGILIKATYELTKKFSFSRLELMKKQPGPIAKEVVIVEKI